MPKSFQLPFASSRPGEPGPRLQFPAGMRGLFFTQGRMYETKKSKHLHNTSRYIYISAMRIPKGFKMKLPSRRRDRGPAARGVSHSISEVFRGGVNYQAASRKVPTVKTKSYGPA